MTKEGNVQGGIRLVIEIPAVLVLAPQPTSHASCFVAEELSSMGGICIRHLTSVSASGQ